MAGLALAFRDPLLTAFDGGALSGFVPDTAALEQRLGHVFSDRPLLIQALTHPSMTAAKGQRREGGNAGYERLEFLGDRVLGLAVAEMLLSEFPREAEGDLARRHAQLVRKETLAEVATEISLGQHVRLSMEPGARKLANLLADSCEAVIAALYLDGGMEAAHSFIKTHWQARMTAMRAPPRDAKTALQEWALARGRALPVYALTSTDGPPHQPVFQISVTLEGMTATGCGPSKRVAETEAAASLFDRLARKETSA